MNSNSIHLSELIKDTIVIEDLYFYTCLLKETQRFLRCFISSLTFFSMFFSICSLISGQSIWGTAGRKACLLPFSVKKAQHNDTLSLASQNVLLMHVDTCRCGYVLQSSQSSNLVWILILVLI